MPLGSAVLTNGGPVDAAQRPERQFVIQKARHDQKVNASPFSCQLVRPGHRSLTLAQPAASEQFCPAVGIAAFAQIKPAKMNLSLFGRFGAMGSGWLAPYR